MNLQEIIFDAYKERTGLDVDDDQAFFVLVEPDGLQVLLPLSRYLLDDVDARESVVKIIAEDMLEARRLRKEMKETTGE